MEMGAIIKNLRLSKGYTQEELGAKIGVKKAAIQKYENGTVENLKRSIIAKLANALEVSPAYLMGWESESDTTAEPDLIIPDILKGAKVAAHGGEKNWTQDEIDKLAEFAAFLLSQRKGD